MDTNALASTGRATNEDENIVIPAERDLGSGSLGNDSLNLFDPQTPVIFTTNFLNCSVCNSLSKQGSKSNWLEPKRPGFQSKNRYRIATLDAKHASHNCPICALLYGIVLNYASRFADFQKTTIYVFEALCDGLVHIYGDPKTESRSHSRILVCYPEPSKLYTFVYEVKLNLKKMFNGFRVDSLYENRWRPYLFWINVLILFLIGYQVVRAPMATASGATIVALRQYTLRGFLILAELEKVLSKPSILWTRIPLMSLSATAGAEVKS